MSFAYRTGSEFGSGQGCLTKWISTYLAHLTMSLSSNSENNPCPLWPEDQQGSESNCSYALGLLDSRAVSYALALNLYLNYVPVATIMKIVIFIALRQNYYNIFVVLADITKLVIFYVTHRVSFAPSNSSLDKLSELHFL